MQRENLVRTQDRSISGLCGVAKRLRRERERRGLSLRQLARQTGRTAPTHSRAENATDNVYFLQPTLVEHAKELGLEPVLHLRRIKESS